MMSQPLVLCYNIKGERADLVRELAQSAGIQAFLVPEEAYKQKIGALIGLLEPTEEAFTGEGFAEEIMLMAFFEKGLLSRFLDSFREKGIPSVQLKAMLTEKNSQWTSLELHKELMEEFNYFANLRKKAKPNGK